MANDSGSVNVNEVNGVHQLAPERRLEQLRQWDCNKICADCEEPEPSWASVNRGVFICTQCAGVHRSLGVTISFVLSCSLDDWTHEQVDNMESLGNELVNKTLEYCVPKTIEAPYGKDADRNTREDFIKAKYVQELFAYAEGKSEMPARRVRAHQQQCAGSAGMVEFIGIVNVVLVECKNMVIKDVFSSDPYCILHLGLQSQKSTIKYNTLNPNYHEHFSFSWNGQDILKMEFYDKDNFTADDHMGVTEINLSLFNEQPTATVTQWYPIQHRNHPEKLQGEVKLELSFTAIN